MNLYQQYMYSYPHKTAYYPLENVSLDQYVQYLFENDNSLYVHVPFCESKCGYCNLFSLVGQSNESIDSYFYAMERQVNQINAMLEPAMEKNHKRVSFQELVLGGGTPMILSVEQMKRILYFAKLLGFQGGSLIVETSPRQTTMEKLDFLKENGISRLSMGIQTMQEEELQRLHRRHSVEDVKKAMKLIKQAKLPCINVDVIYGIEGQSKDSLKATLDYVIACDVDEIFLYPLYIKRGTILFAQGQRRNEETEQLYRFALKYLHKHGYANHSMRRFVRSNVKISKKSCGFESTLALGCGGRSYLGPLHFCTPYQTGQKECLNQLEKYVQTQDFLEIKHGFVLSEEEEKRRYVIKNLLFTSGVDGIAYQQVFHASIGEEFPLLEEWRRLGYVMEEEGRWYLTQEGMLRSDYLGPQLISKEVEERMHMFWRERV